jgi:hypothetical protein
VKFLCSCAERQSVKGSRTPLQLEGAVPGIRTAGGAASPHPGAAQAAGATQQLLQVGWGLVILRFERVCVSLCVRWRPEVAVHGAVLCMATWLLRLRVTWCSISAQLGAAQAAGSTQHLLQVRQGLIILRFRRCCVSLCALTTKSCSAWCCAVQRHVVCASQVTWRSIIKSWGSTGSWHH